MTVIVKSSNSILSKIQRGPLLFMAILAYYLPFIWHKAAAFTYNGIDLAEWASQHQAVRGGNPPLLIPFLLRAALGGVALLMGIQAVQRNRWRWLYAVTALALAVTLMPPLEYFTKSGGDPNYGQQFAIANGTLLGLVILAFIGTRNTDTSERWSFVRKRIIPILEAVITVGIAVMVAVAVPMAMGLFQQLGISLVVGGGQILFIAVLGVYLLLTILGRR